MSMDAVTAAAIESLIKQVLPRLAETLPALRNYTSPDQTPDEVKYQLTEAVELLQLIQKWAGIAPENFAPPSQVESAAEELSDHEAAAMLGDLDGELLMGDEATPTLEQSLELKENISDDQAMQLLADMDAPPAEEPIAEDDDLLASEPQANQEEMSDDEAMALLANMDAPAAPPAAGADADISDDEAMALLAEMDSPATPPAGATAPTIEHSSADDDALALLAAMDGADPPAAASAAAPVAAAATADDSGVQSIEEIGEVPEFSNNDFASDPEMMKDFLTNADELMVTLDETILDLEKNPNDKETIESIFRAAHTLKGAAGMFGFKAIERVMHRMENLFDLVRKGKMQPNPDIIDVVFQGMDVLRTLLEAIEKGEPSGAQTAVVVRNLELAALGKAIQKATGSNDAMPASEPAEATSAPPQPTAEAGAGGAAPKKKKEQAASTIRVDLQRLDHLVNLVGELVIDRTRFATIEESLRNSKSQNAIAGNMSETVQLFGRHMNEIQEIIMKVRMVPIGNAFNKFSRIVRDLSRSLGKEIELLIDGETTELDKTLVEQIGDPLVHLIRNSCDHGVEDPATREAAGKSPTGRIFLSARQEGNHIVITIEDDGKGIPADIIRRKGIEKGLISEDDNLSDRDIFNLIFEPGFSTAETVTNVSGRGVGMDVVKKQISKLKGLIDIDSEVGRGTTITIQLPLTLAIVQSLLVESSREVFAIPITSIIESRRIEPDEIQRVGEAEIIKLRDNVLPLLHLDETLQISSKKDVSWYSGEKQSSRMVLPGKKRRERHYVVIVGSAERRFGIIVDNLLNQQEMVIKSMGPLMGAIPCVAGGSVLGNGEVVLVLDIQQLEGIFRNKTRGSIAA